MDEEGLRETEENKDITIAQPIPMNDKEFESQLKDLDVAAKAESEDIKQIVAQIVKTYHPSKEA